MSSKLPANTAFKQQRLAAWQPILTPKTVLPAFFAIGAIFVPLGIGLFIASNNVNQIIFDYSNCAQAPDTLSPANVPAGVDQWQYTASSNTCTLEFTADQDFVAPVFMYYRLTNFYQNHRRYVKSFDASQLRGDRLKASSLSTSCSPLTTPDNKTYPDGSESGPDAQYYPCGLIANSMFTDTISNLTSITGTPAYDFSQEGIAWPSDSIKFRLTDYAKDSDETIKANLVPPLRWQTAFPEIWGNGYTAANLPDLGTWEAFQVWMRTAGLPNFRKLYGRNDDQNLPEGKYRINIVNSFDVTSFGGTKSIVISTISIIGGRNPFLGVAYMTVGALCILLGVIFLIRHMIKPRKLGDHTYLSWNQQPAGH